MQEEGIRSYTVDLGGVTSRKGLHRRLASELPLPEWYGGNLDALYDVLTDPAAGSLGDVYFVHCAEAQQALKGYFRAFRRVCRAAEEENPSVRLYFDEDRAVM